MKVIVLGKEHRSGTSKKTGKPYNNTVVYYSHARNGVDGLATADVWLDPKTYPLDSVMVNEAYSLDFDNRGYVCGFELI